VSTDTDASRPTGGARASGSPADAPGPGPLVATLLKIAAGLAVVGFLALVIWLAGRGRTVAGSVSDVETGLPIAGAKVAAPHGNTLTDDAGRFVLRVQGQPGVLTLVAEGYESRQIPWAQAAAGGTLDVSLVPTARRVVAEWLDDWPRRNYGEMYERLAMTSQAEISRDEFIARLQGLRLQRARVVRAKQNAHEAEVVVELQLRRDEGTVAETRTFPLFKEQGRWRLAWIPEAPPEPEPAPAPPPDAPLQPAEP